MPEITIACRISLKAGKSRTGLWRKVMFHRKTVFCPVWGRPIRASHPCQPKSAQPSCRSHPDPGAPHDPLWCRWSFRWGFLQSARFRRTLVPAYFSVQTYRYQSPAHAGLWGGHARSGADRSTCGVSLCKISFDLSSMERGELCHGQCMVLLLADYVQDISAAKSNAKTRCTGSVLKSGVWWLRRRARCFRMCWGSGWARDEAAIWGAYSSNLHMKWPKSLYNRKVYITHIQSMIHVLKMECK